MASSVLPTPVGPMNISEAIGLPGRARPALTVASRSTTRSTASSWPITRAANQPPGGVEVERGRVVEEHQRQAGLAPKARMTAPAPIGASSPAGWSWIRFVRNRRGRPG